MGFLDKLFGREPKKLQEQARALMEAGRYDLAAKKLTKAATVSPDDPEPWYQLGVCQTASSSSLEGASEEELRPLARQANEAFEKALEIHDSKGGLEPAQIAKASFAIGMFHQVQKNFDASIRPLQLAHELEPTRIEYALYLSTSLARVERFDEAEQLAVDVLEGESDDPGPLEHWKAIREMAGRPPTPGMDEQKRKSYYAEFITAKNDNLDTGDLAANFLQVSMGNPLGAFAKMQEQLDRSGAKAAAAATETMRQRHGLKKYELALIEAEGEAKGW